VTRFTTWASIWKDPAYRKAERAWMDEHFPPESQHAEHRPWFSSDT
jgi:hypothetical protein